MHTEIEDEMKRRVLQKASHIKLEQAFKEKANMLKKDKEDNAFKIKHKQRLFLLAFHGLYGLIRFLRPFFKLKHPLVPQINTF